MIEFINNAFIDPVGREAYFLFTPISIIVSIIAAYIWNFRLGHLAVILCISLIPGLNIFTFMLSVFLSLYSILNAAHYMTNKDLRDVINIIKKKCRTGK